MKEKILLFVTLILPALALQAQPNSFVDPQPNSETILLNTKSLFQYNYSNFSTPATAQSITDEIRSMNKGYESHPEFGLLEGAPCDDCYEILEKRTETSKTYSKMGTFGTQFYLRNANEPMHYKDEAGQWLTIPRRMTQESDGVFSLFTSDYPVVINQKEGFVTIGKGAQKVTFNRNLELLYKNANNQVRSLGKMNWSRYTAGDDGLKVIEAWPGIDVLMTVGPGQLKTDFVIKHALPKYASGQLFIKEALSLPQGMKIVEAESEGLGSRFQLSDHQGQTVYTVGSALAYEKENFETTITSLPYLKTGDNILEIAIDGKFLNLPSSSYPFVIDPLFSSTNSLAARTMGTKNGGLTDPCDYTNNVDVPEKVTITNVKFQFGYQIDIGLIRANQVEFSIGLVAPDGVLKCSSRRYACVAMNNNAVVHQCYTSEYIPLHEELKNCYPPRQCASYPLPVVLSFFRTAGTGNSCSDTRIAWNYLPFEVVVEGRTLELNFPIEVVPNSVSMCKGDTIQLKVKPDFGVPHYFGVWMPGADTGLVVDVSPQQDTTYVVTVTDQCGNVVSDSIDITVLQPSESETDTIVCSAWFPFTWKGVTIAEPGVHKYVTKNAVGCDSTIYLNVELDAVMRDTITLTACSSIDFKGKTYTSSTDVFNVLKSVNNCDSLEQLVQIRIDGIELWLPNAFTPNGDNHNDDFGPISSGTPNIEGYRLSIFNRWGGLVFSTSSFAERWDGTLNGKPADIGTYFYVVHGKCEDGTSFEQKGDVLLIR